MKSKLSKSTIGISGILDRFVRYVTVDTTADETQSTSPSTEGQRTLLAQLVGELRAMGAADVTFDAHGYVMGTVPATTVKREVPTIGFIAHGDTSTRHPRCPGLR